MQCDIWFADTAVQHGPLLGFRPESREPSVVHSELPGFAATPLHECPALDDALGVGRVLLKDESRRLDLSSFKILGVSWAAAGSSSGQSVTRHSSASSLERGTAVR